jgi:Putative redox-active protein (C_GCAxxG_C_C)
MAISLFTGRKSPSESVLPAYDTVRKLLELFEARFGSTNCRDLTGCDLGTDEGQNYFKSNNLIDQCRQYTEESTRIAMLLIEEKLGSPSTPRSQA